MYVPLFTRSAWSFFSQLGDLLRLHGHTCWRVGFNKGDEVFWSDKESYVSFDAPQTEWLDYFNGLCQTKSVTDIVLYGDTRPIHQLAIKSAKECENNVHIFEEGYLRPYWITYDRDGANGHSRLMDITLDQIKNATLGPFERSAPPPDHWGDTRHHVFYGALYHWFVMFRNRKYPHFEPHRNVTVGQELKWNLRRLYRKPFHHISRWLVTKRIIRSSKPYHLVLMQLEHDAAFQNHSPFSTNSEFLVLVFQSFLKGAAPHHQLVFKTHPLDDGRSPLRKIVAKAARRCGIEDRVHFVYGGQLGRLLDQARSAITVNSTSGQQALWRGIPIKTFGKSVYDKPEFTSRQSLSQFFQDSAYPDTESYRVYRDFLLTTSQLPGGFYSPSGRRQILRNIMDVMLAQDDPYSTRLTQTLVPKSTLKVIR